MRTRISGLPLRGGVMGAVSGAPSVCTPSCGDGIVSTGQVCDDGNLVSTDACSNRCRRTKGGACTTSAECEGDCDPVSHVCVDVVAPPPECLSDEDCAAMGGHCHYGVCMQNAQDAGVRDASGPDAAGDPIGDAPAADAGCACSVYSARASGSRGLHALVLALGGCAAAWRRKKRPA